MNREKTKNPEIKNCVFQVRVTESEYLQLQRLSAILGLPKAQMVREGVGYYLRHLAPKEEHLSTGQEIYKKKVV